MDEERLEELEEKATDEGLSHEEAHELGRMYADAEGKPYSSHDDRPHPDEDPKAWRAEAQATDDRAGREAGEPDEEAEDLEPEEERAVGTTRQPVGPAGSGYVPPKGSDELPT